jgi:hypothetical protein
VHAAHAGDLERATSLARRAAGSASAAGLERAAEAFELFSMTAETELLVASKLIFPAVALAAAPSEPIARTAAAKAINEQPKIAPKSVIPVSLRPPAFPSLGDALSQATEHDTDVTDIDVDVTEANEDDEPTDEIVILDEIVVEDEAIEPDVEPLTQKNLKRPVDDSARPASEPPSSAVAALMTGDAAAVERLAEQLKEAPGRSGLAERLQAMARLARGDTADALRRLHVAAEDAKRDGSPDLCRALLALGVALGAAQRPEEALLTALESLARARERGDSRGEQACIRFIAQLTRGAGHSDLADAWQWLPAR